MNALEPESNPSSAKQTTKIDVAYIELSTGSEKYGQRCEEKSPSCRAGGSEFSVYERTSGL